MPVMQFFCFHLMPYADLDFTEADKYPSSWVVLPNTLFDPVKGAELYHRYLDELEYADQLGYDGVCVNEHHQTAYGLMPIPTVFAGALARRLKNAKLAVLGRALPLLNNPLVVAEEYAILDNLMRGKFIGGFVRGVGTEYHSTGANPGESHERFHEAHDLIVRAWTEPGPFAHKGKHYHFDYVNPWPRCYQKPHPPIWIPSQGSGETIVWAAKMKYTYCQTYSAFESVVRYFKMYMQEAEKNGYQASPSQLAWAAPVYVAETDEIAMREAKPHLESFIHKYLKTPPEFLLPPGYTSIASLKAIAGNKVLRERASQTAESLNETGFVIVGSPETVRRRLEECRAQVAFDNLLIFSQFGTLPAELTRKNIEMTAKEVMPYFRAKATARAAAE
jgi:alkanesulfonate monooxygenase SsuD/methylene tetrahydromethanopterin reductase-like flavin-dependent oxidoreductase (luciferase family)